MRVVIRRPLRHPLHPEWAATPARLAAGLCDALSGSPKELLGAVEYGATAKHAVYALQYPDHPFLGREDRDALWRKFEVPVFAMLLDRQGRLAAWECEAQDGMHIGGAWDDRALWVCRMLSSGWIRDDKACECGRSSDRIRLADSLRRAPARADSLVITALAVTNFSKKVVPA